MQAELLNLLTTPRQRKVQFANIVYRSVDTGEKSKYVCNVGVSVERTYRDDVDQLSTFVHLLDGVKKIAAEELLHSRTQSLEKGIGNNDEYTLKDTYLPTAIEGVFIHKETGDVYLRVFVNSKTVIEKGISKPKPNSSEKTIAKNEIRRQLKSAKIRTFKLSNISRMAFAGDVLEIEGE